MKYVLNWSLLEREYKKDLYEGYLRRRGISFSSVFITTHPPLSDNPFEEITFVVNNVEVTFYQRVLLLVKTNINLEEYM